jgi:DNA polymerase-3 subunit gamma/tau
MSYTVLARKYRSQTFDEVVGQEAVSRTIKNAIKSGRVAHAYLFVGTRGVGKTSMARILAKSLNCLAFDEPTAEPCCKCESCVAVNAGEDIDVVEIDGASNNGVDEVRRLRENAVYRPARSRYKIYIIDEVHMLSTNAFNALLKILEEPPAHVKFIFATTEPNKVPATIQSRCQRFDFGSMRGSQIIDHLRKVLASEELAYPDEVIVQIAKAANGSMRDGLSLLDRLISAGTELTTSQIFELLGSPDFEKISELASGIAASDASKTLETLDVLLSGGLSEVQVADTLIDFLRDVMVYKSAGSDSELLMLTEDQKKVLGQVAGEFDSASVVYMIMSLERLGWSIKNSEKPRALIEATLVRFALSEHFMNVDALLSRAVGTSSVAKKKELIAVKRPDNSTAVKSFAQQSASQAVAASGVPCKIDDIAENWQAVQAWVAGKLSGGMAAIFKQCGFVSFDGSTICIECANHAFGMLEGMGKKALVEGIFNKGWNSDVRFKVQKQQGESKTEAVDKPDKNIQSQNNRELLNHPAIRSVLSEFQASPIKIEHQK